MTKLTRQHYAAFISLLGLEDEWDINEVEVTGKLFRIILEDGIKILYRTAVEREMANLEVRTEVKSKEIDHGDNVWYIETAAKLKNNYVTLRLSNVFTGVGRTLRQHAVYQTFTHGGHVTIQKGIAYGIIRK